MKLSNNFTLEEMTKSATAQQLGINNTPTPEVLAQLKKLCTDILQPIRDKYKHPITITSGYRSKKVNEAVKGAKNSQHMKGEAADIKCSATTKATLFNLILQMMKTGEIKVGQLIWEYGTKKEPRWIHVSLPYYKVGATKQTVNQVLYFYD